MDMLLLDSVKFENRARYGVLRYESVDRRRAVRGGVRCNRADRAGHDARAELADQRLHERIGADLALSFLLTLRAHGGVVRGGRAARRTDFDQHVDSQAEPV